MTRIRLFTRHALALAGAVALSAGLVSAISERACSSENSVRAARAQGSAMLPGLRSFRVLGSTRSEATISAKYLREGWQLRINGELQEVGPDGAFQRQIALQGSRTSVLLEATSPTGAVETSQLLLLQDPIQQAGPLKSPASSKRSTPEGRPQPTPWFYSVGLGATSLSYSQTFSPTYSAMLLTAKGSITYSWIPSRLDLGAMVYGTVLPVSSSISDISVRFLGLNFRAAWQFLPLTSRWRASLAVGGYYATMLVTNGAFGFTNLTGPQIFPSLRYAFKNRSAIGGYFKLSPVSAGGFQLSSLENRELAGGGFYSFAPTPYGTPSVTLDVADLKNRIGTSTTQSRTISLGLGLSF